MFTEAERRRAEARDKIERKVDVLEGWWRDGVPGGTTVPASLNEFLKWENAALGVEAIGSKGTLQKEWNRDLKVRAQRLLTELNSDVRRRSQRRQSAQSKTERQASELRLIKAELADTVTRYAAERERSRAATIESNNLRERVSKLLSDNADLRQQLRAAGDIPRIVPND